MRRALAPVLLVCLAAATVALAACGGEDEALSQQEYQERLTQSSDDLTRASDQFGSGLEDLLQGGDTRPEDIADSAAGFEDQLRQTASELEDVEPPSNAADENEALVKSLRAFADDIADLRSSLEEGDLTEAQRKLAGFEGLDSVQALRDAGQNLQEAGYTFETA
jgi:uncharacterized protein YhaN